METKQPSWPCEDDVCIGHIYFAKNLFNHCIICKINAKLMHYVHFHRYESEDESAEFYLP